MYLLQPVLDVHAPNYSIYSMFTHQIILLAHTQFLHDHFWTIILKAEVLGFHSMFCGADANEWCNSRLLSALRSASVHLDPVSCHAESAPGHL